MRDAMAQATSLASLEREFTAPTGTHCADERGHEDVGTASSLKTEGAGHDDGVWHLALAARALRRVWRRLRPCDLDYYDLSSMIRSAQSLARWLEHKHRTTTSRRWRAWVSKSVQDGGRKILQWVKRPETSGDQPAEHEAPCSQLQRIEKEWKEIWSRNAPCGTPKVDGCRLPPITVAQTRKACKSFETATAVGIEGLRPRHLLMRSDDG